MPSSRAVSRASTSSHAGHSGVADGGGEARPAPPLAAWRVWTDAARPRTLSAAIAPVLVGTAAAQHLVAWRFTAALIVALALQIGVNYANDYFDALKAIDTPARRGPRRATASGLVTPRQMRVAIAVALAVAAVAGAALSATVGWELLAVGAVSMAAALSYSGGPRPYASIALGEVFVFVFFGVVATVGSAYVQVEDIVPTALVASAPVGLLAAAILLANNLRDAETDRATRKITLAVKLGRRRTRALYRGLIVGAFLFLPVVAAVDDGAWPLVALAAAPFAYRPLDLIGAQETPELIRALVATSRLHLIFGALLAVGLWI